MIKKIQVELVLFIFLLVSIFFTYDLDLGVVRFFSQLDYGYSNPYLKEFFIEITTFGDSLWYFILLSLIFSTLFFFKIILKKNYIYFWTLSIFSVCYFVLVGFFTQIIKHVIGRPRPNHTDFNEVYNFNFFSTESIHHSFPSGHTSTIISVTLILSVLFPGLRVFFYICGLIISISRVVNGAHFFTDVIGGALLAIIIFKMFNIFLAKKFPDFSANYLESKKISLFSKFNIVFLTLGILISVGYNFDIYFSSLFYNIRFEEMVTIFGSKITIWDYANSYFFLQSFGIISIIFREILLPLLIIYIFILPIFSKFKLFSLLHFNYVFSLKEIFYIWLSGTMTLIVIVNGLLKGLWGRSRPNDILEFGGDNFFTQWYKIGESCFSNCSFVSGDSSVGFALIMFYLITKKNIYCLLAIFFGSSLGLIRIMAGGHFFSDIIFSQIIVTLSLFTTFLLYKRLI